MTDINCKYDGDREAALIAYLYDDIDPAERVAFNAHLAECARCRTELTALGGVRTHLARWNSPQPFSPSAVSPSALSPALSPSALSPSPSHRAWRAIPTWAQVAAALVFLGVSAGLANLNVRYDATGLTVRTGWMNIDQARLKPAAVASDPAASAPSGFSRTDTFASKSDLTALEQRLRDELRAAPA